MVLLLVVNNKFQHCTTDLYLLKLFMIVLSFRDVSNYSSLNTAIEAVKIRNLLDSSFSQKRF